MFQAAFKGHVGAIRELARANANPFLAALEVEALIPLEVAAQRRHLDAVSELIQRFGAKGFAGKRLGASSLYWAAAGNHADVIVKLTDAGVVDDTGDALIMAAQFGYVMPAKLLSQPEWERGNAGGGGAFVKPPLGRGKEAALVRSLACCPPRSHKIARLLLDAGADTSLVCSTGTTLDETGVTPMALALRNLGSKTVRGKPATENQLHRLEAVHRMLLQEEAIPAASWLWLDGNTHATSQDRAGKTTKPSTTAMLPMSWRRHGAGLLLPAVFRRVGGFFTIFSCVAVVVLEVRGSSCRLLLLLRCCSCAVLFFLLWLHVTGLTCSLSLGTDILPTSGINSRTFVQAWGERMG